MVLWGNLHGAVLVGSRGARASTWCWRAAPGCATVRSSGWPAWRACVLTSAGLRTPSVLRLGSRQRGGRAGHRPVGPTGPRPSPSTWPWCLRRWRCWRWQRGRCGSGSGSSPSAWWWRRCRRRGTGCGSCSSSPRSPQCRRGARLAPGRRDPSRLEPRRRRAVVVVALVARPAGRRPAGPAPRPAPAARATSLVARVAQVAGRVAGAGQGTGGRDLRAGRHPGLGGEPARRLHPSHPGAVPRLPARLHGARRRRFGSWWSTTACRLELRGRHGWVEVAREGDLVGAHPGARAADRPPLVRRHRPNGRSGVRRTARHYWPMRLSHAAREPRKSRVLQGVIGIRCPTAPKGHSTMTKALIKTQTRSPRSSARRTVQRQSSTA